MNTQQFDTSGAPAWEQGQPADQPDEEFPLLDYLQVLWFRRRLIVAITIFVAVVAWINVNQIQSVYTASSTLMIGVPQSQVVDIQAVLTREIYGDEILGEIEVLRSRGLATKLVERLRLLNYEEFNPGLRVPEESFFDFLQYLNPKTWIPPSWKKSLREAMGQETELAPSAPPSEEELLQRQQAVATTIFLGKLAVEEIEYANVITIRFSSLDPKLAARIANEIPEAYILDQLEAKFEAADAPWTPGRLPSWTQE